MDRAAAWSRQYKQAVQRIDPCQRRQYSVHLLRIFTPDPGLFRPAGDDVLRDQWRHRGPCGFDAFAGRADKAVEDALKGLAGIGVQSVRPQPLFRRRG